MSRNYFSKLAGFASNLGSKNAIVDHQGGYTYSRLLQASNSFAEQQIRPKLSTQSSSESSKVAYLVEKDATYVVAQLASWQAGSCAIPLSTGSTQTEIEYYLGDSKAELVICSPQYAELVRSIPDGPPVLEVTHDNLTGSPSSQNLISPSTSSSTDDDALVVYTSGTTGKPKGVVHTHASLQAQLDSLSQAWEWSQNDRILNVLPMHHVHGVVNVLNCSLWNGATCEMHEGRFSAKRTWETLLRKEKDRPNVFMAVPTVYANLAKFYFDGGLESDYSPQKVQEILSAYRLMVSGSAALPVSQMEQWRKISGQTLLERFGMTETLMALSNPYRPIEQRLKGCVGSPLPGVNASLLTLDESSEGDQARTLMPTDSLEQGELIVRSTSLFDRYLNKPEATAKEFYTDPKTGNKWFKTGDCAERNSDGIYSIKGRLSADIIKKGGYKISALDIESVFLEHPAVEEICVLGIPDEKYGDEIVALVCLADGSNVTIDELQDFGRTEMSSYKVPRIWKVLDALPRNQMGKINKKQVRENFDSL